MLNHSNACIVLFKSQWDLDKSHVIFSSPEHNKHKIYYQNWWHKISFKKSDDEGNLDETMNYTVSELYV